MEPSLKEMMSTREGREQMRQEIDFLEVANLSEQIKETAEEASRLAKELQQDDLDEVRREEAAAALKEIVEKGTNLATRRAQIISMNQ